MGLGMGKEIDATGSSFGFGLFAIKFSSFGFGPGDDGRDTL